VPLSRLGESSDFLDSVTVLGSSKEVQTRCCLAVSTSNSTLVARRSCLRGGRTTQRVVPLSRLGESSDFLDIGDVSRFKRRGLNPLLSLSEDEQQHAAGAAEFAARGTHDSESRATRSTRRVERLSRLGHGPRFKPGKELTIRIFSRSLPNQEGHEHRPRCLGY
jgi:hypothetical protein